MTTQQKPMESILTKNQKKIFGPRFFTEEKIEYKITATVRYDDECGNGHNSFSITADIKRKSGNHWVFSSSGCCHKDVEKHFPKLAPFIKWHLFDSTGPLHYLANTLYLAGERDCWGKLKGEPHQFEILIQFGTFPIVFKYPKHFLIWLKDQSPESLSIAEVPHEDRPGDSYDYGSKYTFHGCVDRWHECPFDTKEEAEQFLAAFKAFPPTFPSKPTAWGKGKAPELEAARHSAVWPEATLEQLQNKALLEARLPALREEFRKDIESLGFIY